MSATFQRVRCDLTGPEGDRRFRPRAWTTESEEKNRGVGQNATNESRNWDGAGVGASILTG